MKDEAIGMVDFSDGFVGLFPDDVQSRCLLEYALSLPGSDF